MQNLLKVANIKATGPSYISANKKFFDIMLVRNDEEQSVEVVESTVLDFDRVIEHLNEGNSVFITPKSQKKDQPKKGKSAKRDITYFNHI